MRTLDADHLLAQKGNSHDVLFKVVVQGDTYDRTRIIWGDETETPDSHLLTIVLDNSDKALDSKDYKGRQCILSLGEIDANGVERYSPLPKFYVMDMNLHSSEGLLTATLTLVGEPNMYDMDKASQYLNGDNAGSDTIKDLLTAIAGNGFAPYTHTSQWTPTYDSEDALLDTLQPKGAINIYLNDSKLNVTNRLLLFTKVTKRFEDDGEIHFFVPTISGQTWVAATAYALLDYVQPTTPNNNFTYRCTTAGTSGGSEPTFPTTAGGTVNDNTVVWTAVAPDYEYALDVAGEHTFLKKVNRKPFVIPNSVQVSSITGDGDGFVGLRTDTASSSIRLIREFIEMTLDSSDQGDLVAAGMIEQYRLRNEVGSGEVPMNVGQETHDWIKFTDKRQDDVRLGNVGYLQRQFGSGTWTMRIGLGDIRNAAFPGLVPPDVIRNYRVHEIPQVAFAGITVEASNITEGGSEFVPPSGRAPGVRPPIDPRTDPETGLFPDIIPTITSGVIAQRLKQNQDLGFQTMNEHAVVLQRLSTAIQELRYANGGPSAVGFTGSGGGGVAPSGAAGPQGDRFTDAKLGSVATISGIKPTLRYEETDQTDPAGRRAIYVNGDILKLVKAASADWASETTLWEIDSNGNITQKAGSNWVLASDNNIILAPVQYITEQRGRLQAINSISRIVNPTAALHAEFQSGSDNDVTIQTAARIAWDPQTANNGAGVRLDFLTTTSTTRASSSVQQGSNEPLPASIWAKWETATHSGRRGSLVLGVEDNNDGVATEYVKVDGKLGLVVFSKAITTPGMIYDAATELTISGGAVTLTQGYHTIDTENDDPSDILDTLSASPAGNIVFLQPANSARTIVVEHGTGNIFLKSGVDLVLDSTDKVVMLFHNGTNWVDATGADVGLAQDARILAVMGL